jgi:hypothetical protein
MNRFIEHSQVVDTAKYNTVTDFHTRNHSTLVYSVYFHLSSLSVSWQRIYNTGTIKVSLNHTLPISLYYSTHKFFKSYVKSSQVDFYFFFNSSLQAYCLLLLTPPAYDTPQQTFVLPYKPSARTFREQVMWFLPSEFIGALTVAEQRSINIRPIVACAYRGMFIELLPGNYNVLFARV